MNRKEYMKEYYEKNKDKMIQSQIKKINCEYCNKLISKCNLEKHNKTTKHLIKFNSVKTT